MTLSEIRHRFIETNGIRMHVAEQGEGPPVIFCHGFPQLWYSWRHQLPALAAAGFQAVAPDMRGYGQTERPEAIDQYTTLHLVGDIVGLLDALGERAVVVGHGYGAHIAWHAAQLRPDRFCGVVGLGVPFRPPDHAWRTAIMPRTENAVFYHLYFQEPGVAEAELERDPRFTLLSVLYWGSGDAMRGGKGRSIGMVPKGGGYLSSAAPTLPPWLTEDDIDYYAGEFVRTGFRGGLNWFRNIDRNWELMAAFAGRRIEVPALYLAGDRDMVVQGFPEMDRLIARLSQSVPKLRPMPFLPGGGHWIHEERPEDVNRAVIAFLRGLDRRERGGW